MTTTAKRGIYGKLAGDTTLNNLLATPPSGYSKSIFYEAAPDSAGYPFVLMNKQDGRPTETFGDPSAFETDIWMVKAIDRGASADVAESVQARLAALLNDAALSISGSTVMYLRRQSDMDYAEDVNGVVFHHSGSLYRLVYD